jgi:hypothetical protein
LRKIGGPENNIGPRAGQSRAGLPGQNKGALFRFLGNPPMLRKVNKTSSEKKEGSMRRRLFCFTVFLMLFGLVTLTWAAQPAKKDAFPYEDKSELV